MTVNIDDRRLEHLRRLADDAISLEAQTAERRAATEAASREEAERVQMLEATIDRLVAERGRAVGAAEGACRAMTAAFLEIQRITDDLRACATQQGHGAPLTAVETERRLSLMLAGVLQAASRTSGPSFGALKFFWSPYANSDASWPADLSMPTKEKTHAKQADPQPNSERPDGTRLPSRGADAEGRPDGGVGDGDARGVAGQPAQS